MSHSNQGQQNIEVPCALFRDGDDYKLQSIDGKLNKTIHLVDVAPQCRFKKRQKEEMPFFFQVYYDEGYDQKDLEENCRSHGLTETSPEAYIQHCKDAHPCVFLGFELPPGANPYELLSTLPDYLKRQFLGSHHIEGNPAQYVYWFDNMATPIFFEGEKDLPTTDNGMETVVDAYFIIKIENLGPAGIDGP